MRHLIRPLCATAVMSILTLGPLSLAREEKLPLDKVPKPVLDAVKTRFKDATPTAAAKEMEKGRHVYEVTVQQNKQDVDVTLTPEGDLLMIEKRIDVKDMPAALERALQEKYPNATYRIIEEIVEVEKKQEKLAYYEVLLVTAEKRTMEVQVTPDGKVVTEERDEEDEEEDERDE